MKTFYYTIILSFFLFSCKKDGDANRPTVALPIVITTDITPISSTTITTGGKITDEGNSPLTERGVCWSTSPNPVVSGNHTADGNGSGYFKSVISGLTQMSTYYVRAYATNIAGTAYGNELIYTNLPANVYVVCVEYDGVKYTSKVLKNGVASILNSGSNSATARSIFVKETDVYVAGDQSINNVRTGTVWKNGIATTLSSDVSSANSIFVSGTDVYVGGSKDMLKPAVWKNGLITILPYNNFNTSLVRSIYVSNEVVYAAGDEYDGSFAKAKVWQNASATNTLEGTYTNNSVANSIVVSDGAVYVAGQNSGRQYTWKNGVTIYLLTSGTSSIAYSAFVIGADIYTAGYEYNGINNVATVWKNGVATYLTDGIRDAIASSVYVYGTDVYVSGSESNGTKYVAKVWKNGVATSLSDGTNDGNGIAIFIR